METRKPHRLLSALVFTACGVWLIGLGVYFVVLRPPLLPEDTRYIGADLREIRGAVPGLEHWLQRVFTVMGGFMAGAGALTVFVARTAIPSRARGAGAFLALTGLLTVALMSVTNFVIGSDFRWLLLAPALLWLIGMLLYATDTNRVKESPALVLSDR